MEDFEGDRGDIMLVCKEGERIAFPSKYLIMNRTLLEIVEEVDDDAIPPLPLNWPSAVIHALIDFCELHQDNPANSHTDQRFFENIMANNNNDFYDLISLANYMDNEQLILACSIYHLNALRNRNNR